MLAGLRITCGQHTQHLSIQPMIIYHEGHNKIWKPSFTLPHQGWAVIDYIDDPQKFVLEERLNVYNYNQVPATVLGLPDLDKPNWQESLYEKLLQETKRLSNPSVYKNHKRQPDI